MRREARCSFCGKHQDQVKRLVAGQDVFICDECVRLCMEIIEDPPTAPRAAARTDTRRRRLVTLNELLRRLLHGVGTT